MMRHEVIILTEAGKSYGYGHLTRCLAIAQGFKENNVNSHFFLRGDSQPKMMLNEFDWQSIDWIEHEVDVLGKIVILDSYHTDEEFCKKIFNKADRVLFVDDNNRVPYPGGYVLNSVIGAENIDYPLNDKITYLFGPAYHPLRKEFWHVPDKVIRRNIEKILITFGGTDVTNETPGVLRFLTNEYVNLEKHVVIGKGFTNVDEIKAVEDENTVLIYYPDAATMKNEMLECDVAISAAGQTIYELARVGVFTYAVKVAENQDKNLTRWMETGFLSPFDTSIILPEKVYREKACIIGSEIIDGQGVHRIVEILAND